MYGKLDASDEEVKNACDVYPVHKNIMIKIKYIFQIQYDKIINNV